MSLTRVRDLGALMHDTTREILPEILSEKNMHDGCTEEPHPSGE